MKEVHWTLKRELDDSWMGWRVMDGVVHVVDETASSKLLKLLARLTRRNAYGAGLSLLRTREKFGCFVAFGFRWRTFKDEIVVDQDLGWISDMKP